MNAVRVPMGSPGADGVVRLGLTPAEVATLGLPRFDCLLRIRHRGHGAAARWRVETHQLELALDIEINGVDAVLYRDEVDDLALRFAPVRTSRAQQRVGSIDPVRAALAAGVYATTRQVDLARDVSMHRATADYRERRLDRSPPVGSAVDRGVLRSLAASPVAHLLVIGPSTPGIATTLRLAIELAEGGRGRRIYIASPDPDLPLWRRHLEQLSYLLPECLRRDNISFITYDRLPVWRPPSNGHAILVVGAAEQAHRRWGARVATTMRRAGCAIALGTDVRGDRTPAWVEDLAEDLDAEVASVRTVPARSASVHPYTVPTEQLGADVPWRLQVVAELVADQLRHTDHIDVRVADRSSCSVLRELLARRGLAVTTGQWRSRPQVALLGPGDQLPRLRADTTVHADLDAVRLSPDLEGTNLFVVAHDSTEHALASVLVALDAAAQRFGVTTSEALDPSVARRWERLRADLLRGADPGPLLANAMRAAHRSRRRRERLSGGSVPAHVDGPPPAPRGHDGPLRYHANLIVGCLEQTNHEIAPAGGEGTWQVLGTADPHVFPVGTVISADPSGEECVGDELAVDASPGSTIAEALFANARRYRVSMDVPVLPRLADIPVAVHAPRMRLDERRLVPAGTAHVVGEYLSDLGLAPSLTRREFGDAVVRGLERRQVPLVDAPGLPGGDVIDDLVERLEDAAEPGAELVTARFFAGEDVHLIERWSREDGPDVLVRSAVPRLGPPIYLDAAGGRIRVVDSCDGGHLVDQASLWGCPLCAAERCASCLGGDEVVGCRLCGATGCAGCVVDGLCRACIAPTRAPDLDRPGLTGWRVPGVRCLVGRASVVLQCEETDVTTTYVLDEDVDDELHIRTRAVAAEHGLPVDTILLEGPGPDIPPSDGLVSDTRDGVGWQVAGRPGLGWRAIDDAGTLPDQRGPSVRPMSVLGLGRAWLADRHRAAGGATGPVLCRSPFVERDELLSHAGGLTWRTTRFAGDGSSRVVASREVDIRPPATPRDDHDGRLLGVAHVVDAVIEIHAINSSAAVRVHRFGEVLEWFAPGHPGADHGTELAWHLLGRGYGVPSNTILAAALGAGPCRAPNTFAEPSAATLLERSLTPRATLDPRPGATRPLDVSDLEALGRRAAPRGSSTLSDPETAGLLALAARLRGASTTWQVDVSFVVGEEWLGAGRRIVSYVSDGTDPVLPPLDDTGEPGEDFGVDSAGHLHQVTSSHCCEACDQHYCRVCPDETELAPCAGCGQPACGPCRTSRDGPRPPLGAACGRCGRSPCGDCGRRTDPRPCSCCGRELCRWCVPDGREVCETCSVVSEDEVPILPGWIPTGGCRVAAAVDPDAHVVTIVGAHRREVVLVRGGEVVSWRSFHDDVRQTCTAIAAARRWGQDHRIVSDVDRTGPSAAIPGDAVWSRCEMVLEVGPPSRSISVPLDEATSLFDAVCLAVDDGGPYPSAATEAGGSHLGSAPSATPLPLRVVTSRTSVTLDRLGLVLSTDNGEQRGGVEPTRAAWVEQPWGEGRGERRHLASVGPVSCEVRVSGRDLELVLRTPDGTSRYALADEEADLLGARLAHRAGWRSERSSRISACVLPSELRPLPIGGDEVVDRAVVPVARAGDFADDLTTDVLTSLAAELDVPPPPERSTFVGSSRRELVERFALEPTVRVALGLQVQETFAGGRVVEYRVWPEAVGVTYEYEGRSVRRLDIDTSGHVADRVRTCQYCSRTTCDACERPTQPCAICAIEICGRCAPTEGTRVCTACRRLTRAPLRGYRGLFGAPRPWQILSGSDVRHEVIIGRTQGGIRVLSRGTHAPPERGILPYDIAASFIMRAFDS